MPDWERLVAHRLARLDLEPDVRREVIIEIAAHLEEHYAARVREGSTDAEAQTLAHVEDWIALRRKIRRSKEDSMGFIRRIVMPGVGAALAAIAALKLFVYLFVVPYACGPDVTCIIVSADGPAYLPWLATLPIAGALAAAFARRMGARPRERFVAAMFPAIYLLAEMTFYSIVDAVFYWRVPIYWVIVPAIACALGAVWFLGDREDPIDARTIKTFA